MSLEKLCKYKLCSCQSKRPVKNLKLKNEWFCGNIRGQQNETSRTIWNHRSRSWWYKSLLKNHLQSMWIALSNVHPPITPRTMHAAGEENGRITKVVCTFCHRLQIWRCLQQVGQSIKKWNRVKSTQSLIYYSFIIKLYIIFLEKYTIQQVSQLLVKNSDCINFEEISSVKITVLLSSTYYVTTTRFKRYY